jgi:hypothetical protein
MTHRAVVVPCDQGIANLIAHDIVTAAVRTANPTDLVRDLVTAAASRGIELDGKILDAL